jgi:ParB family chromosome partitioning protein
MNNFIDEHGFKIDMKKSGLLKQYEEKDKLTEDTIYKILSGEISKTKKTKKASAFKIKSKIIQRFFTPEQKDSEIEQIIEKALEQYFQVESKGASQ